MPISIIVAVTQQSSNCSFCLCRNSRETGTNHQKLVFRSVLPCHAVWGQLSCTLLIVHSLHYPPHSVMRLRIKYSYKMKVHVILPIPHLDLCSYIKIKYAQCKFITFRLGTIPQGLQAPPEKSIAVTFHAVVPLPFWEWEESTSRMHIRFDDYKLGLWKDCGKMVKHRLVLPGFHILVLSFTCKVYVYVTHLPLL